MYTSADILGKPITTPYKPTIRPKMDISFIPVEQPNGNKNYIAVVDDDDVVGLPIDTQCTTEIASVDTAFSKLYKEGGIYATPTPDADDDENNRDIFSLGKDPVKIFYIGSVTVVGLYILFRILSKTK